MTICLKNRFSSWVIGPSSTAITRPIENLHQRPNDRTCFSALTDCACRKSRPESLDCRNKDLANPCSCERRCRHSRLVFAHLLSFRAVCLSGRARDRCPARCYSDAMKVTAHVSITPTGSCKARIDDFLRIASRFEATTFDVLSTPRITSIDAKRI